MIPAPLHDEFLEINVEAFWFLLVIGVIFGPLIMSIIALTQAAKASREVKELASRLGAPPRVTAPEPKEALSPEPLAPKPAPVTIAPPPIPEIKNFVSEPHASPPPAAPSGGLEVTLGAKAASFVGIAAVVIAVVFFVGYAIQHNWIGPAARVTMGLLAGAALVVAGHVIGARDERFRTLSRALTGGGSALFYFSVFAAYGVYHLVGVVTAGVGLVVSASVVLGLSLLYNSQAVALLGVLGAFVTPLLIASDFSRGLFPLIYVAVVNVPMVALGLRRNWQTLYNLAFLFTVFYAASWLSDELAGKWGAGIFFVVLYYAQFAAVNFCKIGREQAPGERGLDILRLAAAASLLGVSLYFIIGEAGRSSWRGVTFALVAAVHGALAVAARRRLGKLGEDAMSFTVIAIGFASFALPVQLDGAWVSLGWAIEGVLLAWFGLRAGSTLITGVAMLVGLLGLAKSLGYDATFFDDVPPPFFNSRFAVGLLASIALAAQAWLHGRKQPADSAPGGMRPDEVLWSIAVLSFVAVSFADAFWTMPNNMPWLWLWTTAVLMSAGMMATAMGSTSRVLAGVGFCLLFGVMLKTICLDLAWSWSSYDARFDPFTNSVLWLRLALPVLAAFWFGRRQRGPNANALNLLSIISVLVVASAEIHRAQSAWADSALTIFWAASAMALTVAGLMRRRAYLRYAGLALFGLTVLKVFIADLSDLRGLQRIAAFLGVGLLLLLLSFTYQRVAPKLMAWGDDDEGNK